MALNRRGFLGSTALAAGVGLAGCVGGDGGTEPETTTASTPTETETATGNRTTTEGGAAGETVRVATHPDLGEILVGTAGMTLYMFDQDTEGAQMSACYDSCADAWPPLTTDGEPSKGAGVTAQLSTFERETGETQVMAGGWPQYYFASDEEAGDANGQGVNEVWWVLGPDGTPKRSDSTTAENDSTSAENGGGSGGGYSYGRGE